MKQNIGRLLLFGAAGLAALTGCGQSSTPAATAPPPSSSTAASSAGAGASTGSTTAAAASSALKTSSTSLGTVVVDDRGMTVYYFDKDTANSGKSACTAGCDAEWPAVKTTSTTPAVEGVTGKVGTITRNDGTLQVTINGLPVYTYRDDTAAGDVKGQGAGGIWWVVAPDGTKVTAATSGY
jgi:predicted lipoprotein with Yx(FWY)xxD motif